MNTTHETSSSAAVALAWIDAANRQDVEALVALSSPEIEIVGPRGSVRGTSVSEDWIARAGLVLENRRTFARRGSSSWTSAACGAQPAPMRNCLAKAVEAGERPSASWRDSSPRRPDPCACTATDRT